MKEQQLSNKQPNPKEKQPKGWRDYVCFNCNWFKKYITKSKLKQNQGQKDKKEGFDSASNLKQTQYLESNNPGNLSNRENNQENLPQIFQLIEMIGSFKFERPRQMRQSFKKVKPGKYQKQIKMKLGHQDQQQWLCFNYIDQKKFQENEMRWSHCTVIRGNTNNQFTKHLQGIVIFYNSNKIQVDVKQFINQLPGFKNQTNYFLLSQINPKKSNIMPVYRVGKHIIQRNNNPLKFDFYVTKDPILSLIDIIDSKYVRIRQKMRANIIKMMINFFKQIIQLGYFLQCLSLIKIVFLQKTQNNLIQTKQDRKKKLKATINSVINQDGIKKFNQIYELKVMIDLRHIRKISTQTQDELQQKYSFLIGLIYINLFLKQPLNKVDYLLVQKIKNIPIQQAQKYIIKKIQITSKLLQQGQIHSLEFYKIRQLLQAQPKKRLMIKELQEFLDVSLQKDNFLLQLKPLLQGTIRNTKILSSQHFQHWSMTQNQINDLKMILYIKMICFQDKYLKDVSKKLELLKEENPQKIKQKDYILLDIKRIIHYQNIIIQQEKYEINNSQLLKISLQSNFKIQQDQNKSIKQQIDIQNAFKIQQNQNISLKQQIDPQRATKIIQKNKSIKQLICIQNATEVLKQFCKKIIKKLIQKKPIFSQESKSLGQNLIIAYFYQQQQYNIKTKYLEDYRLIANKLQSDDKETSDRLWIMLNQIFIQQNYESTVISQQNSSKKSVQQIVEYFEYDTYSSTKSLKIQQQDLGQQQHR